MTLRAPSVALGTPIGLHARGKHLLLRGQPYRQIGVNFFNAVYRDLRSAGRDTSYLASLDDLVNNYGIRLIRVSASVYDYVEWRDRYYANKSLYWSKMDEFFAACEARGIGVIANMCWFPRGLCDLTYHVYGARDPVNKLADPASNAWALVSTLVQEFMERYHSSPSLWAYEFGNEMMNGYGPEYHSSWKLDGTGVSGSSPLTWLNWGKPCALPGGLSDSGETSYPATDKMSMANWFDYSTNLRRLFDRYDSHNRLFLSGCALGNQFAVNVQISGDTLGADTLAQRSGVAATGNLPWLIYYEREFPAVSMHVYPQKTNDGLFFAGGNDLNYVQLLTQLKTWCDAHNRLFGLTEFGATQYGPHATGATPTDAAVREAFNSAVDWVVFSGQPIALAWNYGGDINAATEWMTWDMSDPSRRWMLEKISAANSAISY